MRTEVGANFVESVEIIREQFDVAATLFEELKQSAAFIYDLSGKYGLSNEQIEKLKTKIDGLFISVNESIFEASNKIIVGITQNVETIRTSYITETRYSQINGMTYEELYQKYNDALESNVQLTRDYTELGTKFNEMHKQATVLCEEMDDMRMENARLTDALEKVEQEKAELETRLEQAETKLKTDYYQSVKENEPEVKGCFGINNELVFPSSVLEPQTDVSASFPQKAKTVEDFIHVFDQIFHTSDEIVQLIKHLGQWNQDAQKVYLVKTLEKSRHLRQVLNDVLVIFRKARINPTIIGEDVSSQIAEELKRIYETLKSVKLNTEQPNKQRKKVTYAKLPQ